MATRRVLPALLLLVAVGAGSVACSNNAGEENFSTVGQSISGAAGGGAASDGVAGGGSDEGSGAGATVPEGAEVPGVPREVIYTADLVVRVDDVEAAAARARDLATDAGGFVAQQSADLEEGRNAEVTLRVPVAEFDDVMDGLTGLGEVLQRGQSTQDVTDQVVDLEARIANTEVSAQRLRELLAEADGVPNVLAIETELTNRETQIEQMKGQLQVLRDQVDLSTVTIHLTEDVEADPEVADDLPGFVKAFRSGAVALANIGLVLLAVLGFTLPFVPVVAVVWVGWRWWRRRHPKTPKPSAPLPGWPAPAVWPPAGAAAAGSGTAPPPPAPAPTADDGPAPSPGTDPGRAPDPDADST